MHDQELLEAAFKFDPQLLEYNRQGQLSEKQKSKLRHRLILYFVLIVISVLGSSSFCILIYNKTITRLIAPSLIMIFASVFMSGIIAFHSYLLLHDLKYKKIKMIQGGIETYQKPMLNGATQYRLIINKTVFMLTRKQFLALQEDSPYQIYYTAKAKYILSVNRLPHDYLLRTVSPNEAVDDDPFPAIEDLI